MLDKWIRFINGRLDRHMAIVIARRGVIERERAGDDARQHAGREFENAEGFTTPLPKAFQNAQNVYARARRDFEANGGMQALMLLVVMLVARAKRDDALAALKRHEAAEALRQDTGVHAEVKPHYAALFRHGVEPRHLANVRPETTAIVADLIRWDGEDSEMVDPDNPMTQVFGIYASRLILKPGQFGDRSRSVPGTPVAPLRHSDPRHYRFDELVPAEEAFHVGDDHPEGLDAGGIVAVTVMPDEASPVLVEEEPAALSADPHAMATGEGVADAEKAMAEEAVDTGVGNDEYALPARFDAETARKIRIAAAQFVADDPDWDIELQAATSWFHPGLTTDQVIVRVEATPDDPRSTPFRYFVDAARIGGLKAGQDAYREATIRRVMFQIVTVPAFAQARSNLGLT